MRSRRWVAARCVTSLGLVVVMAGAAAASPLRPRMVLAKPTHTVAQAYQAADRIVVKFSEGSGVHLRAGGWPPRPWISRTSWRSLQAVGSSAGRDAAPLCP